MLLEGQRLNKRANAPAIGGIHRYELADGKTETVVGRKRGETPRRPRISSDGNSFYYIRDVRNFAESDARKNRKTEIICRDLVSGKEQTVRVWSGDRLAAWPCVLAISPDGSQLAMATSDQHLTEDFVAAIEVINTAGGKTTEVLRIPARARVTSVSWTPDGKRLVYSRATVPSAGREPVHSGIWAVAVNSGRVVKLNLAFPGIETVEFNDLTVCPDGQRIAFRSGSAGDTGQLWVMDGMSQAQVAKEDPIGVRKVIAQNSSGKIAPGKLSGPHRSIYEPSTGVRAALPPDWELTDASQLGDTNLFIDFKVPDGGKVLARIAVSYDDPKRLSGKEIDAWLRNWSDTTHLEHRNKHSFSGYKNRTDSFVSRTVAGLPALRWEGEFARDGENYTEFATLIY